LAPADSYLKLISTCATEKGIATIDKDSVCLLAEKTAINIHSVHDIRCNLKEGTEGLVFSCQAQLLLGSNLVDVGAESQSKIKETVELTSKVPARRGGLNSNNSMIIMPEAMAILRAMMPATLIPVALAIFCSCG